MYRDILRMDKKEFDELIFPQQYAVKVYCINTYTARLSMYGSKKPTGVKPGKEVIKNDTDPADDLDPRTREYNKGFE